jgi:hypothetical protein
VALRDESERESEPRLRLYLVRADRQGRVPARSISAVYAALTADDDAERESQGSE